MNVLQIKIKEDGSLECSQDFKIIQGSYRNILLNVVVPHTLLLDPVIENNINLTGNNVRVGAIIRTASCKNLQTERYELQWVKSYEQNNVRYSLYQRIMPKEFTMWDTVAQNNARGGVLQLVFNVVNWTKKTLSTGESTNVEQVVASPILDLQVYPSAYLDVEPIVDDDQLAILQSQTNNLSAKVDRIDSDLDTEKINIDDLQNRTGTLETNVSDIVKDTTKLKTDVSVLQEDSLQAKVDIDDLQGRTNALENDVSTLKTTTKNLGDEMSDLREDIFNRPIFCGWFKNVDELNELFPTATENDFAYIENGNVYQWKNGQWTDSAIPSPSSTTPISQTTGQETNVVMSQKAVTDFGNSKLHKEYKITGGSIYTITMNNSEILEQYIFQGNPAPGEISIIKNDDVVNLYEYITLVIITKRGNNLSIFVVNRDGKTFVQNIVQSDGTYSLVIRGFFGGIFILNSEK